MQIDKLKIIKLKGSERISVLDTVIRETEVVLRLDGRLYRRFYCLSDNLYEFALGHLFDERIANPSDVTIDVDNNTVSASRKRSVKMPKPVVISSQLQLTKGDVLNLVEALDESCPLYSKTGGTHVVGISYRGKRFFTEDISRHCAIDKALGMAIKDKFDFSQSVLVTSCRQTASTINKVVNAGIPVVITISAPTSLAITKAINYGVTLIGFARGEQFNLYSHPHRIVTDSR